MNDRFYHHLHPSCSDKIAFSRNKAGQWWKSYLPAETTGRPTYGNGDTKCIGKQLCLKTKARDLAESKCKTVWQLTFHSLSCKNQQMWGSYFLSHTKDAEDERMRSVWKDSPLWTLWYCRVCFTCKGKRFTWRTSRFFFFFHFAMK